MNIKNVIFCILAGTAPTSMSYASEEPLRNLFEFCQISTNLDLRIMTRRQSGVSMMGAMQAETALLDEITKGQSNSEFYQREHAQSMALIVKAFDYPVGENRDDKLKIIEDFRNDSMALCIENNTQ
jgi:hypothetical protein